MRNEEILIHILNSTNHKAQVESLRKLCVWVICWFCFCWTLKSFRDIFKWDPQCLQCSKPSKCSLFHVCSRICIAFIVVISVWWELPIQLISIYRQVSDKAQDIYLYWSSLHYCPIHNLYLLVIHTNMYIGMYT